MGLFDIINSAFLSFIYSDVLIKTHYRELREHHINCDTMLQLVWKKKWLRRLVTSCGVVSASVSLD